MKISLQSLPPWVAYASYVVADKAISLITVPLMALLLAPAAFGQYDLTISLIEFICIIMTLGVADTMIRFVSVETDPAVQKKTASEFLGTTLLLTAVFGVVIQILAPFMVKALNIKIDLFAVRCSLAAATVVGLVEIPMVWLRIKTRASKFFAYAVCRSLSQATATIGSLVLGYGVEGLMISNAVVLLSFTAFVVVGLARETGVTLSRQRLREVVHYGFPLIFAALALFAMGTGNRWFLSGTVSDEEIAYFGLASRFALVTFLVFYPFILWWGPKRLVALREPGGLQQSRQVWSTGFALIITTAVAVALAGPLFIRVALPESYAPAAAYVPFIVLVQVAQQMNWLNSVGTYARETGYAVLRIDALGGITAVIGYFLLVPRFGVPGAIAAMLIGQCLRNWLYLVGGRELAPIDYPILKAVLLAATGVILVALAPASTELYLGIAWGVVSAAVLLFLIIRFQFVLISDFLADKLLSMARLRRRT